MNIFIAGGTGAIGRADRAMYAAKAASKKRYVFFSPS